MTSNTQQGLKDFLNLSADNEVAMFIVGTKKKTSKMRYDEFVKYSLPPLNDQIKKYLDSVDILMRECGTIKKIEELHLPSLPEEIRLWIANHIDKQKGTLVEKTYLCLDLIRAASNTIGTNCGKMAMHYGRALQMAPKIVGLDGQSL
jgi:hypothetical protein